MKTHRVRVIVRFKPGVLDPQGKTIRGVLQTLGYQPVKDVHSGKVFELDWSGELDARARETIQQIAEKILSNPLIEEYEIQWLDGPSAS